MLTTQQAADRLGISRSAILKAIKRGVIRARRFGRDWVLTPEAVEDYRTHSLGKPGRYNHMRTVHHAYFVQQGSSNTLHVPDEAAWYVIKEAWEGSRLLSTVIISRHASKEDALAAKEAAKQ